MDKAQHGTKAEGTRHGAARLTEDNVRAIREGHRQGHSTFASLAAQHGVANGTIQSIIERRTWKHLVEPKPEPVVTDAMVDAARASGPRVIREMSDVGIRVMLGVALRAQQQEADS